MMEQGLACKCDETMGDYVATPAAGPPQLPVGVLSG